MPLTQPKIVTVYQFTTKAPENAGWRFFYTTNANEGTKNGWTISSDMAFYAYGESGTDIVAVNRFVAKEPWRYQYSTKKVIGGGGWKLEGPAFYASTKQISGTVPVYQYYAIMRDGGWKYMYSLTNKPEMDGWKNEGVVFYVPEPGC